MLGFEALDTGEIDIPEDFKRVEFYLNNEKTLFLIMEQVNKLDR